MTILQAIELLKKYNSSQKQKAKKTNTDTTEVDQALSVILAFFKELEKMQFIITDKTASEILPYANMQDLSSYDWVAYDINWRLWGFKGDAPIATKGTWKTPKGGSKKCLSDWTFEDLEENGAYLNYEDSLCRLVHLSKDDLINQAIK